VSVDPTILEIQSAVCRRFHIPLLEMRSARRSHDVARPRQIAMFLSKQLTPHSLPSIGQRFGGRDHTTVIHAVRRIKELCASDREIMQHVVELRAEFKRTAATRLAIGLAIAETAGRAGL